MNNQVIGIFAAMGLEARLLKTNMTEKESRIIGGISFTSGKLRGKNVVLTISGPGTDNAVQAVTTLILTYKVDTIIVNGLAGSLSKKAGVLSVIIAEDLINWEVDVTPVNLTMTNKKNHYKQGQMYGEKSEIHRTSSDLAKKASALAQRLYPEKTILTGTILTGNSFVTAEIKERINRLFPEDPYNPLCVDMESASVVKICNKFGINSLVVRILSDNADGSAAADFSKLAPMAAKECQELIITMLGEM